MKILLVSHRFPWPLSHGTYLRVFALAKRFTQGHDVSLFALGADDDLIQKYTDIGVRFCGSEHGTCEDKPLFALSPFNHDRRFRELLTQEVNVGGYDAVILFGAKMLQYADLFPGITVIADVIDDPVLEWRRVLKLNWYKREGIRLTRYLFGWLLYERRYVRYLDHVVFVSETDSENFKARNAGVAVHTITNGVDLEFFRPVKDVAVEKNVVFTGNMGHQPNLDAALLLVRDIAPKVWARDPEVRFVTCGAKTPPELSVLASERVDILGWVDDIRDPIARAGVVVLPMISGTGIKNKLLEAWAMEKPVVMTTLACQGVRAVNGENCRVADGLEPVAEAILQLLNEEDEAKRVASAGRQYVESFHCWDRLSDRYCELFSGGA